MVNRKIKSTDETKLRCLIVDDEPVAIEGLTHYIGKLDFLEVVRTAFSAIEARQILNETEIDLLFLDINLPGLSGIDFLETLENAPLTILTTAYSEYALDGFRLNAVDYLVKPIGFQRFFQAVSKARDSFTSRLLLQQHENSPWEDLFLKKGDSYTHLFKRDILYVEGMQNYVKIHMEDKSIVIHQTMSSLEQMLPEDLFFRIHRSYIINVMHISSVSGNRLFIRNRELPVSPARKEELFNRFIARKIMNK